MAACSFSDGSFFSWPLLAHASATAISFLPFQFLALR
jgi:hypothetical protein